jgi:glycosyltransferase involved in cell wall biosynthesis
MIGDASTQTIVVDNGSTDGTGRVAAEHDVEVLRIERTSVGGARNAGAGIARGRVVAFLDADIVVTESWIVAIREVAALPDWRGELSGDVVDVSTRPSWLERHWFGAIYRRGPRHHLNSGNLVIAREDFLSLGGFDASLVSGEDAELCQRALRKGMRLAPRRSLHVHHLGFPLTISQFMRREIWHGGGDFVSLASVRASPVALATVAFIALHALVFIGLVAGLLQLALIALAAVVGICVSSSFIKFRTSPFASRVVNSAIYYVYFVGRALSACPRTHHDARPRTSAKSEQSLW